MKLFYDHGSVCTDIDWINFNKHWVSSTRSPTFSMNDGIEKWSFARLSKRGKPDRVKAIKEVIKFKNTDLRSMENYLSDSA
ncbi:hypothetical protein NST99_02320 [Paenibacillus sp. FSL L8-0470]|uniref:hypothetical protein n=1 Tax=Paenibacillus sp. FSL L8-0470 TaxID=2954688 RepID=UPI0030F541BE